MEVKFLCTVSFRWMWKRPKGEGFEREAEYLEERRVWCSFCGVVRSWT